MMSENKRHVSDRANSFGDKSGFSKLQRLRESIEGRVWKQLAKDFSERKIDFPDLTDPYEINSAATTLNHGRKSPAVRRQSAVRGDASRGNPGGYSQDSGGGYSPSGQSSGGYDGGYSPSGQSSGGYDGGYSSTPAGNSGESQAISVPSGSDSIPLTSAENGEELHDPDFFISQAGDDAKYASVDWLRTYFVVDGNCRLERVCPTRLNE